MNCLIKNQNNSLRLAQQAAKNTDKQHNKISKTIHEQRRLIERNNKRKPKQIVELKNIMNEIKNCNSVNNSLYQEKKNVSSEHFLKKKVYNEKCPH